jgi:hypothetical protein
MAYILMADKSLAEMTDVEFAQWKQQFERRGPPPVLRENVEMLLAEVERLRTELLALKSEV